MIKRRLYKREQLSGKNFPRHSQYRFLRPGQRSIERRTRRFDMSAAPKTLGERRNVDLAYRSE